jgi:hypothetical protein
MQLNLEVDQGDGPQRITTTLWAMVQWERKFNVKASQMADRLGIEDIAYLAWQTLISNKKPVASEFDAFLQKNPEIRVIGAGDDPPTLGAPTEDS